MMKYIDEFDKQWMEHIRQSIASWNKQPASLKKATGMLESAKGGQIVGFEGDTYYEMDDEMTEVIKQDIQVEDLESFNKIPFWDRWGGKLTLIGIILVILAFAYFKNRGKDDEEKTPQEEKKAEE